LVPALRPGEGVVCVSNSTPETGGRFGKSDDVDDGVGEVEAVDESVDVFEPQSNVDI
jgi:hypothetical protein